MSQGAVTIMMAGAAAIALLLLVPALRQARSAGDLDASTALTLGMAWLVSLPPALVALAGEPTRRQDVFFELVPSFPGWYPTGVHLATLIAAALGAFLLLRRLTSGRVRVHTAGLLAVLLWAVAYLASGLQGGALVSLSGGALLVCLIAATVLPRGRGACLGAGIFGVTLGIVSGVLAVFRYDVAFVVPCKGACGGLGLTGVLPNEDLLGTALALSIPFAYLGFRGRARHWFALYLTGMAIATGSQTATVAAVITLAALLIVRPRLDADRRTNGRAALAGLVLAGAVFSSVYIVLQDRDPSDLTDRPALWQVASRYVQDSPWFGYGPAKWASLYKSASEIPREAQDSTHNQWMDVLFRAGWVGTALLVIMMLVTLLSSGRALPGVALTLATIITMGSTERPWALGTLDLFSFSLVALILTGASRDSATANSEAEQSAAPHGHPTCGSIDRRRFDGGASVAFTVPKGHATDPATR